MARITINIPDEQVDRVRAAFTSRVGKPAVEVTAGDVKDALVNFIRKVVRQHEQHAAEVEARASLQDIDVS